MLSSESNKSVAFQIGSWCAIRFLSLFISNKFELIWLILKEVPFKSLAYGKTKLRGEEGIEKNMEEYYIFRTAWLYGVGGNNFVKTMTKLGSTRDEINVVSDQHGSPTYAKDLTEIIYQAINKKIPYGIYNATNEGYTTWYEFTKEILAEQGIECKVNPVTTEEYIEMMKITQAKRPFNSQMSKAKLEACGIKIPDWKDGLRRYLEEARELEK